MRNKWTRERIIHDILEREAGGRPLTVGGKGIDRLMYAAARRFFGSWRNAVQAAGIAPRSVFPWERWSPAKVLVMIRHLAQRRRPLTLEQTERRYSNMVSAARRHFGSWNKAILAAGIDPTRLQRVVPWNRERIIEAILTLALRNAPLAPRRVEPRSLVVASQRFFGSWTAAISEAGLDPIVTAIVPKNTKRPRTVRIRTPRKNAPRDPRIPWSKERVIAALHARLREQQPIHPTALKRQDRGLYNAAQCHLNSWDDAMRAAGLDPGVYRRGRGGTAAAAGAETRAGVARPSQPSGVTRPNLPA